MLPDETALMPSTRAQADRSRFFRPPARGEAQQGIPASKQEPLKAGRSRPETAARPSRLSEREPSITAPDALNAIQLISGERVANLP